MGRTAPRAALRRMLKNEKPGFHLSACSDLLRLFFLTKSVSSYMTLLKSLRDRRIQTILVYLNLLLFLRRLAEEARTNAFQNRSRIIKPEHIILAAKAILKKSRG